MTIHFESGREKIKKPGKCPKCRGTYIEAPMFTIAKP